MVAVRKCGTNQKHTAAANGFFKGRLKFAIAVMGGYYLSQRYSEGFCYIFSENFTLFTSKNLGVWCDGRHYYMVLVE